MRAPIIDKDSFQLVVNYIVFNKYKYNQRVKMKNYYMYHIVVVKTNDIIPNSYRYFFLLETANSIAIALKIHPYLGWPSETTHRPSVIGTISGEACP